MKRGPLPDAQWGYCRFCQREVELRPKGRLAPHKTHTGPAYSEVMCDGSLTVPTDPDSDEGRRDVQADTGGLRQGSALRAPAKLITLPGAG